jgi:small subunit ribosomal protein S21
LKGGVLSFMVYVRKQPGDSDDAIIRKFVRKVTDAGIIPEVRRRQFYLKPSLARKAKQEEARRNKRKVY